MTGSRKDNDIFNIPDIVNTALPAAATPNNAQAGFWCSEIWPYNPDILCLRNVSLDLHKLQIVLIQLLDRQLLQLLTRPHLHTHQKQKRRSDKVEQKISFLKKEKKQDKSTCTNQQLPRPRGGNFN